MNPHHPTPEHSTYWQRVEDTYDETFQSIDRGNGDTSIKLQPS